jgi:hypothetical protein
VTLSNTGALRFLSPFSQLLKFTVTILSNDDGALPLPPARMGKFHLLSYLRKFGDFHGSGVDR